MVTDKILEEKFRVKKRFVEEDDAGFILSLRRDGRLGRFLSQTGPDLDAQRRWIRGYKARERRGEEFYFIFCRDDGTRYGVSRIYDMDGAESSFEVGSWLFSPESPLGLAVLADLSVREYAFEKFGFDYCKFEVRKDNRSVVDYHKKFGPELTGEDALNFYFRLDREKYTKHRNILLKIYGYDIK